MKLAIFDFDGTLLSRDTLPCLGDEWKRQNRSRFRYLNTYATIAPVVLLYKAGFITREKMKYLALSRFNRIFRHMTKKEINEFFSRAYPGLKNLFNSIVLEEMKNAQDEGYHCVLLSGAYNDLLRIVAKDLGVPTVMGFELYFSHDEKVDLKKEISFVDGKKKLDLLKESFCRKDIDWQASRAYGDSYTDVFIMNLVGEPVAVNPDPGLLAYAQNHNWRIIQEQCS
ncbi:MAG: HAD family hydrolase [Syntrophomonadaceae bacterium]|nr:HAD family hydrolase [Syntrophomonadaceae bacterium]MDD3898494.1 HAD family hydrolase [Syntrophomonadaceae bacterium]